MNRSIAFFDEQFRRQDSEAALRLNPFETQALPFLRGEVLDLGCGLGNLACAAAERGCRVTAVDASPAAIGQLQARAAAQALPLAAMQADLQTYRISADYDAIVAIGVLMFFNCASAARMLAELQRHVRPGGCAVVNVLIEGTTFLDMFEPGNYCLFSPQALLQVFSKWQIEFSESSEFAAPRQTVKRFITVVARQPLA